MGDSTSGSAINPRRRPKVRIIKPKSASRTATLSLFFAVAVALVTLVLWRVWQRQDDVVPMERTLTDVELTWRCEVGHTFQAAGQVLPRPCWTCDRPAYPLTTYHCPTHGPFDVLVRFAEGDDGNPFVSELRLVGHRWAPAEQGLQCPRCRKSLVYRGRDPMAPRRLPARKPGG